MSGVLDDGISFYRQGRYEDALAFFLSLPEDSSADPVETAYFLGLCYAKLKRWDDSILYLEQVVTSAPEEGLDADSEQGGRILQCRYLLAVIYCLTGRTQIADFELNKLLQQGYRTSQIYASLAYIAWENGNVDVCIDYYNRSLSDDGGNPTALNGLGYVLANEERDLTNALSYCKRALSASPESAACLDSMGWVYFKLGMKSESLRYLEEASRRDSSSSIIREHLETARQLES